MHYPFFFVQMPFYSFLVLQNWSAGKSLCIMPNLPNSTCFLRAKRVRVHGLWSQTPGTQIPIPLFMSSMTISMLLSLGLSLLTCEVQITEIPIL